ncbi:MAG: hypothetical protein AAFV80_12830, partial [Bacteroidota bacterium]
AGVLHGDSTTLIGAGPASVELIQVISMGIPAIQMEISTFTCMSSTDAGPAPISVVESPCNTPADLDQYPWSSKLLKGGDYDEVLMTKINGENAFLFHVTECCDKQSYLYDCKGNKLCIEGGITGGDCHQIFEGFDKSKMKKVWTAPTE